MAGEIEIEVPNYEDLATETDVNKLAAYAFELDKAGDVDDSRPNVEEARGHKFSEDETKDDAGKKAEEEKAEADKQAAEKAEAEKAAKADDDKGKEAKADDDKTKEGKGTAVKTADGEGEIPYAVLKNTREANAQLKEQLAQKQAENERMQAEIEAVKKGATTDSAVGDDLESMTPEQRQEHINQIKSEIQTVEDDYDPQLAKPMLRLLEDNLRLAKRMDAMDAKATSMDEAIRNQPTREDEEQNQEIEAAIDRSPVMAEWYSRSDETWYQRAVQVHQVAVQSDPDYQAMSHEERMKELPGRVQAVFGKDNTLEAKPTETKVETDKTAEKPEEGKPKEETKPKESAVPRSMDDLPPGGTPDSSGKYGPVGELSGHAMTNYFTEHAKKGDLEKVLAGFG